MPILRIDTITHKRPRLLLVQYGRARLTFDLDTITAMHAADGPRKVWNHIRLAFFSDFKGPQTASMVHINYARFDKILSQALPQLPTYNPRV